MTLPTRTCEHCGGFLYRQEDELRCFLCAREANPRAVVARQANDDGRLLPEPRTPVAAGGVMRRTYIAKRGV